VASWHNFNDGIKNPFAAAKHRTAEPAFVGPRGSGFDYG
jgi:hypothetical protein